jgi:deoxyribodipyrimidine photo-lyase
MQILWHYPRVVNGSFREKFDRIEWINNEEDFERWKNGTTGIPIVDAGMRQLNETGYMHNRVRMIVASFLTKHLLIDWRWGEAYLATKLLDFELASNNGNWQWAAGSGVDASPWFRIFNPVMQSNKFDPTHDYIRRWVPEYGTIGYVGPMIDLDFGRKRCLEVFKRAVRE